MLHAFASHLPPAFAFHQFTDAEMISQAPITVAVGGVNSHPRPEVFTDAEADSQAEAAVPSGGGGGGSARGAGMDGRGGCGGSRGKARQGSDQESHVAAEQGVLFSPGVLFSAEGWVFRSCDGGVVYTSGRLEAMLGEARQAALRAAASISGGGGGAGSGMGGAASSQYRWGAREQPSPSAEGCPCGVGVARSVTLARHAAVSALHTGPFTPHPGVLFLSGPADERRLVAGLPTTALLPRLLPAQLRLLGFASVRVCGDVGRLMGAGGVGGGGSVAAWGEHTDAALTSAPAAAVTEPTSVPATPALAAALAAAAAEIASLLDLGWLRTAMNGDAVNGDAVNGEEPANSATPPLRLRWCCDGCAAHRRCELSCEVHRETSREGNCEGNCEAPAARSGSPSGIVGGAVGGMGDAGGARMDVDLGLARAGAAA
eukprot:scaffold29178_cov67-Isochrysis_galbana.AAC.1